MQRSRFYHVSTQSPRVAPLSLDNAANRAIFYGYSGQSWMQITIFRFWVCLDYFIDNLSIAIGIKLWIEGRGRGNNLPYGWLSAIRIRAWMRPVRTTGVDLFESYLFQTHGGFHLTHHLNALLTSGILLFRWHGSHLLFGLIHLNF